MEYEKMITEILERVLPPIIEAEMEKFKEITMVGIKKEYYTVAEASFVFGPSDKTLYRWNKQNILKFTKLNGMTFIKRDDIESLFKETQVAGINLNKYNQMHNAV